MVLQLAATKLQKAVEIEASFAYMEPPRVYQPVRQCLGYVLLLDGRLEEAIEARAYRTLQNPCMGTAGHCFFYQSSHRLKNKLKKQVLSFYAGKGQWCRGILCVHTSRVSICHNYILEASNALVATREGPASDNEARLCLLTVVACCLIHTIAVAFVALPGFPSC